ncbi:MAG: ATP-dependent Clp protease proteolytic subunit [Patescibacteria group bacterium]
MAENFDGTLALVIEGKIEEPAEFAEQVVSDGRLIFHSEKVGQGFVPADFSLFSRISSYQGAIEDGKQLRSIRAPSGFTDRTRLAEVRRDIDSKSGNDREIAEILFSGYIRFVVALNTQGGSMHTHNLIAQFQRFVQERKGVATTLGSEKVGSAGAGIFMMANDGERYLSKDTSLMFHLDSGASAASGVDEYGLDIRRQAILKSNDFLLSRTETELHDDLEDLFAIKERLPDRRLDFHSDNAARFGWVKVAEPDSEVNSLRAIFNEMAGVTDDAYEGTVLDRFFTKDAGLPGLIQSRKAGITSFIGSRLSRLKPIEP